MRRIVNRGVWAWVALFSGWLLFYWLTAPAVHIEADDAYEYAYDVEQYPFWRLAHPYHPLHLPLMRLLFVLGKSTGVVDRSFQLVVVFGAVFAAAAVVLFSLVLWKRIGVRRRPAIVAGGLLGFSYGFWRYAAEVETYALAFLLALSLVWWTFKRQSSVKHAAVGGLFGVLAVLGHVLNLIPALGSVPLYLGLRNGKKHVAAYLAVFILACAPAAYTIGSLARVEYPGEMMLEQPGHRQIMRVEQKDLLHGTLVFGHVVATGNFLFAFPQFRSWIGERFPNRRLEGEKLLGAGARPHTGRLGSLTLMIVILAFGWTLYGGITRGLPPLSDPVVLASLFWLISYVPIIAYEEAWDQPEAWLLALVPSWLLFARLVHVGSRGRGILLVSVLPGALLLHNGIGGMAMLKDPELDRHRLKARWLLENAKEEDVILTSESAGFSRYLLYYSSAEVMTLHQRSAFEVAEIHEALMRSPDRVFVTGEVVDPPDFMRRSPESWMRDSDWVVELFRGSTRQVHQDDWGGVFRLANSQAADTTVGQ
jgi:hypothetical protein